MKHHTSKSYTKDSDEDTISEKTNTRILDLLDLIIKDDAFQNYIKLMWPNNITKIKGYIGGISDAVLIIALSENPEDGMNDLYDDLLYTNIMNRASKFIPESGGEAIDWESLGADLSEKFLNRFDFWKGRE